MAQNQDVFLIIILQYLLVLLRQLIKEKFFKGKNYKSSFPKLFMIVGKEEYRTVWFENGIVKMIDQNKLPFFFRIEDFSRIDLDRCIGCGLCATTCDFDAITVQKKDEDHQWVPQPDYMTALMDIYKERREGWLYFRNHK